MTKIHEAYPPEAEAPLFWENVDVVIIITYDNSSFNRCGIGGVGGPYDGLRVQSLVPGFVEGRDSTTTYYQVGTTLHLFLGDCDCPALEEDDFDNDTNPRLEAGIGHELGHSFGFNHTAWTGDGKGACVDCGNPPALHPIESCGPCGGAGQLPCEEIYINVGRYSLMRAVVDDSQPFDGLLPYHPSDLLLTANFWATALEETTITTNVRNYHVPQIRSLRAKYCTVQPSGQSLQSFLLVNHQGSSSSDFDNRYGGSGLLIWHVILNFFDPELPDGRDGNGRDRLEADWCEYGDGAEDFWDGTTGRIHFSSTTNPNTNWLAAPFRFQVSGESVFSAVGIENIRQAGGGSAYPTDMIVDIYVDATQYVTAPNGGGAYPVNQPVSITWQKREYASISSVDLHLSTNGGSSYGTTIATSQSNTGSYSWTPTATALGTQNRIRLTSDDPSATNGVDASDASFTVWEIVAASVNHDPPSAPIDSIDVTINWDTSVPTQAGADLVRFYDAQSGGNQINPVWSNYTTSNGGLSHRGRFKFSPCIPNVFTYYEISSTLSGGTAVHARTSSTRFKVTACLEP